jgi:hypothetical protein
MPRQILYAYVDGYDLDDVALMLEVRLDEFISGRPWVAGKVWGVNQREGLETCSQPGDLPVWNLGLNLELPDPGAEQPGWFADVETIAHFLGRLHSEFGREFVLGIAEVETGIADDLFIVSTGSPDVEELKLMIGVGDIQ